MFLKIMILLSVLPILYKLFFWVYVVQLKEYRWDRFKEYLNTKQWKKAIFNFFLLPEIIVFLIALWAFFNFVNQNILVYFLILLLWIENLYVLYKTIKKKLIFPKKTWRSIILLWMIFLDLLWGFILFYFYENILYIFIPIIFALFPWYVVLWNIVLTPFINIKKQKIFRKAWEKTEKLTLHKIWIAWSFGKTSIKEYLAYILSSKYKVFKTPKNVNSELWLANLVLKTNFQKYDFFIAEMWAYKKWEIKRSWEIINHKDAFLTWIWDQHIWLFGNQQNIIDGKSEIWEKVLKNNWKLYINDNIKIKNNKIIINNKEYALPDTIKTLLEKDKVISYWLSNNQSFSKINHIDENWTKFEFNYQWKTYKLKTNLIWKAQIENLTWTLTFAVDNKIKNLQKAIESIKQPEHTLNIERKQDITIIDDTYNLSVNWLLNGVDVIWYFKWKKILIVDDILELWKNANEIHYNIWKKIAKKFNQIMFVWVNYKEIFEKWVKDWDGIIINKLSEKLDNTILLFEGKKTWKIMKNLMFKLQTK